MKKILALIALATTLSGCAFGYRDADVTAKPNYRYRLGPNDLVRVSVWGRPELLTDTAVGPDGRIALPLAGVVPLTSLTLEEAAERIAGQLREFVRDPIVTIELRELRSSQVHIIGEVRVPGSVGYYNGLTAVEAIQRAGSFIDEFANKDQFLLVRDPTGAKQIFLFDMEDLLHDEDGQKDVFLQPGDIVYVKPRYVTMFARWVRQALSPISEITGSAARAATFAYIPRPF